VRGQARIMRIIGERDCKACDGGRSEEGPAGTRLALAVLPGPEGRPARRSLARVSLLAAAQFRLRAGGGKKTARPRSGLSSFVLARDSTTGPTTKSTSGSAGGSESPKG